MSLKNSIFADVWRIYGTANWLKVVFAFIQYREFRPILTYRVGRHLMLNSRFFKYFLLPPIKLLHRWFQASLNCEIPISAEIGGGLWLSHGYTVVINGSACIGKNFTCLHLVTIGGQRGKGSPVIGDNVVIAAGAMVIGSVHIADGATIGACSLVLKTVEENAIIVGNPQRTLKISEAPRTPNPAPDYLLS